MNTNDAQPLDPHALDRGAAKLNPAPKQAYEITLTIDNAPGPFEVVRGSAQFDVTNEGDCGYIDPISGALHRITRLEPFVLNKAGDNTYKGIIYLDYMMDEAYYGRAVCHWEFTAASGYLRATTDEGTTRFLPGLAREDVLAEKSTTTYFWRGGYPRRKLDNFADIGSPSPLRMSEEVRHDLFTITLSARKVAP
ncbi:MAG: hypothetical protein Q4G62_12430 [Pseudomonadota bacterium]|nr:hypothetical protein [Pseudomonadota bacterium]